jgi:hypothetical protein
MAMPKTKAKRAAQIQYFRMGGVYVFQAEVAIEVEVIWHTEGHDAGGIIEQRRLVDEKPGHGKSGTKTHSARSLIPVENLI